MKIVAKTEPFESDENGEEEKEEEEEEGLVEICVPDCDDTHNKKGEADVEGKDAAVGGLCAGLVTGGPKGVRGECMVFGVNGKVGSCHGKGRRRDFCCWWRRRGCCCWWWLCKGRRWEKSTKFCVLKEL